MLPYPAIVGRNGSGLHIQWAVTVSEEKEESTLTSLEQQENGEAGETGSQVLEESADDPSPATETDNPEQQGDSSADANALQQTNQHCPATANHEQVAHGT